ncbi:MAG TPA: sn-glycerol-3-phosphate ABC transporter substrate-binding protein UgpB [Rhodopila sp.]|uniref:sn-glycerol-3-phosphate ABC transporter substrate-binding protein UgpB n=1 Tax=Rhodopila sp. TaxID=2480087 RepID=UPI002CD7403E|nr:sn-glycerol-3-phosphate ABC transporter substrate-binding protein UgpB [Rhodopila sp.]HVY14175.1 sn-glycerol-3-phosphate ABC transporter substrate-binding protein UgpB [Rhodopila sp.]
MQRRTLLAAPLALAAAPVLSPGARAADKVTLTWWHAMTAALAEQVGKIADGFNASQSGIVVQPVYKGSYADLLTAVIAASRAGQAPHVAQVFEVGTGTMLAAGKAVKQVWDLSKETGVAIDPKAYIPAVRGYYSLADGRMAAMPFNSSTAVMWINKDAFQKAGLDPDKPPKTWQEVRAAAGAIKAKNAAPVPMTTSWPTWVQVEQYSALHNLAFASKENGFEGLDAVLEFNSKAHVKHIQRLLDMAKEGTFKYSGRDGTPDPLIISGDAAISFGSSSMRGDLVKSAKHAWAEAYLPYDPEIIPTPKNSIIGGASLWTMTAPGRTPAEYKAVAEFLHYIGKPEVDAAWAQNTGYVQVTFAGYDLSKKQGFFDKNIGADIPVEQLARGTVTPNTRGLRLGRLPEIRNIIQEELEKALQGGQNGQQAMDVAVARGNKVLKEFARSVKT